jgi:hypothetical protein
MENRQLGKTDLVIRRIGVGLAEIGYELTMADASVASKVLNTALDNGINFFDTSACYGISEELIGRTVAHRRDEFVLATKAGHVTGDYEGQAWSAQTIEDSIDRSLTRMKTDHLDLVQLHSCDVGVLERGEVIRALQDAREAGKTRYIGYSGDNEAAVWAVESGIFDTLQTSFNLVDQRARKDLFSIVEEMGVIAKRPLANAVWGCETCPSSYDNPYFRRAQKMEEIGPIPGAPNDPILLALGFVLAHDAVDVAITGTSNADHLRSNIEMVKNDLPINQRAVEELHRRFEELGQDWDQQI